MSLDVGHFAPKFSLFSDQNKLVVLQDFIGRYVVLYFYPRDNTPSCTVEANEFSRLYKDFSSRDAVILGVSKDHVATHQRFKEKQNLPFLLLSDEEASVSESYGVHLARKSLLGKKCIQRSTFLIDRAGCIQAIWSKVKVNGHAQEVLNTLIDIYV